MVLFLLINTNLVMDTYARIASDNSVMPYPSAHRSFPHFTKGTTNHAKATIKSGMLLARAAELTPPLVHRSNACLRTHGPDEA